MRFGGARLAGAVLASLASLGGAAWSLALQVEDTRLTAGRTALQAAPLPEIIQRLLPPGTPAPPPQRPLTAAERQAIGQGLWREPLDPQLFNLLFADFVRTGRPAGEITQLAALLAQLGWRYTPAQQNLMLHALGDARFDAVLDRVDGLLRRQRRPDLAYTILSVMEGIPQVHGEVLAKLLAQPDWRGGYLAAIGPASSPALLDGRIRTMNALLTAPSGMTLPEMAPSLIALNATGRGRAAHSLWMRRTGAQADGNLVYDPAFRQLADRAGTDLGIPFEWRLGQDLGYAAQSSPEGVVINWDQRGVPVFLSQTVPVRPGGRYALTFRGEADNGPLGRLLSPVLQCGTQTVRFEPAVEPSEGQARYLTDPLPDECDMGLLAINGTLDSGSGPVTIILNQVILEDAD
ncbi:hypothetical protein [Hoeflea sp.]|uniref:hypothetical protein n=1 Tax=Hoeflea sp. TaxID=1940281 RepID=UPI0019B6C71F|nr:hypothetical protein [Hoeflea sp.]MBC7281939.1 hypothetical protein [Hoeflea sp.]